MTKHTTKALNTLLIFAILCAFCITPAAAATATENVPIIFSKRSMAGIHILCTMKQIHTHFGNIGLKMEIKFKKLQRVVALYHLT